ncbi:MAG: diguanylate cyclase (GGDEF)-like protein [Gammaproteobacteria bacterium]|jgi:diguanylate cyclase (GGDEF)-like protein
MKEPSIPQDEESRLKTLRSLNILDTLSEERFDRLTRMAKRLFNVPIALVSLVDENRQWFKSCIGLCASETPRDISFCGHAILGNDIFIVPDATADERFADNPLVLNEPYIRFYAGCPLRFTDGSKLGTLCIIDKKPRNFSDEDLESLKDLASTAERELGAIQLVTLDDLTNILNRRGLMMLGQHSIKICIRQKIQASLVYLDLDNFKPINDTFGHAEGDRVLTAFANKIGELCRESDIFARIGGDEFVMLLMNTSKAEAEDMILRFQQSLTDYNQSENQKENQKENQNYNIEFSHGIVEFNPYQHPSLEALLADGDRLMYENKKKTKTS